MEINGKARYIYRHIEPDNFKVVPQLLAKLVNTGGITIYFIVLVSVMG